MLALTMGDPAGIGGEITMQAWSALRASGPAFVALADPKRLGPRVKIVGSPAEAAICFHESLPVLPVRLATPARAGHPDPANAPATIASIERAVELTLAGETSGVVTNPISKATLYAAGFAYPGHTEFLGAMTGNTKPVMMLASPDLCVVPVTIHISLREALDRLTTEAIIETTRTTHTAMQSDFNMPRPRLAVAGLNPHAGEGGTMGYEEIRIIGPAIAALQAEGIDATGPYPPDTLFTAKARPGYDAAICMYHDQALIPLKTLAMDRGVNVTLGLPIVRTSPDHGTAFDIAGTGRADPASLIAALRLAAELVSRRGRGL